MKLNKKGISLIVLVITIIVMIVLAAAIILSLSSSGVIGRANEAKSKSDETNMLQAANVAYGEYLLERNLGQTNEEAEEYVREKLGDKFSYEELNKLNILSDGTVQILPTIPTGFTVSIYEGEQKISDGLVVYKTDATTLATTSQDEAQTSFDQYVWIPVEGEFERVNWKNSESFQNSYKEPYEQGYEEEVAEYNKMKANVEKHGGFYIARYEAGKGENNTVVSKKEATVWSAIQWGTKMNDIGTKGAVYLSKSLYPENEDANNVVSTLCYGVQWDAVMNFMKDVPNIKDASKKYINDSMGMGYYAYDLNGNLIEGMENKVQPAGYYAVKNIYDMAGNAEEWTMEANPTYSFRIKRGGGVSDTRAERSAFFRGGSSPFAGNHYFGFRVALYLK